MRVYTSIQEAGYHRGGSMIYEKWQTSGSRVDEAGVGHMKGEKAKQLKITKQISAFPDTSKVIGNNANFRIIVVFILAGSLTESGESNFPTLKRLETVFEPLRAVKLL